MPDTITSLKKENDALKLQINSLQHDFAKLRNMIEKQKEALKQDEASTTTRVQITEFQNSLEFLSAKYDTLSTEEGAAKRDLQKLNSRLLDRIEKVDRIDDALEQLCQYSYQYNVKIVGIPQQEVKESAYDTSMLCVDLFKKIGADVNYQDIDIAHRVPSRRNDNTPAPIVCKFVRRNSKECVMKHKRETNKVSPLIRIFDHLTPKNQHILAEARTFKEKFSYQYCWTKNSTVYLRKSATSRAIRIKELGDLQRMEEGSEN
ncbi:uncharacterized protein LOC114535804 [Dendronephthya gigantea]|uniref:uncharacterized protein LOC114535804 n=1 Tax=Dendronephthya gigantea TaxID=151771 RepID=UPI0010696028|nr:uncharacterized protein LOC114535804 [Dendronephthya gigantea]